MRFIFALIIGAAAVALVVVFAPPAAAHFCTQPAEINVGEDVVVHIGVGAEATPVRRVEVEVPDGFELKEPIGYQGYEGTVRGRWVRFEGAELAPYACAFFSLSGQATRKGRLVARVVTTDVDGKKTRYDDVEPYSLTPAQLIFAGIPISMDYKEGSGGGFPWAVVGVAALGGGLGLGLVYRRRKSREAQSPG